MKRKLRDYLNSKEKNEYNNLDKIFEMYLNGNINKFLSKYTGVHIYPTFNKHKKAIQLNYNYQNIYAVIDFFENKYNVVIYHARISIDDLEKLSVDYDYQDNFNLEKLIKEIDEIIKNHPELKDVTLIEKKKKLYSLIAWISFFISIVICGSIGLYCIITGNDIKGNIWWGIFFIVIPLIVWFIFDVKSKRVKK